MKILVTGSRYRPVIDVKNVLDRYIGAVSEIIVGDSTGADEGARAWASEHHVDCFVFDTDEDRDHFLDFSRKALDEKPSLCLAFPIKGSKGTLTCIDKARSLGIPVTIIPEFDNEPAYRDNNDKYVYAVETDGSLMKASMKRVIARYENALKRLETL